MVTFVSDNHLGGHYYCTGRTDQQGIGRILKMQNVSIDPSHMWSGNIGGDPKFESESPDLYGTGWWYLQQGSHAIDSGIAVVDSNGIAAGQVAPGYGWGSLTFTGTAPDIGAYEFNGENPSPPTKPPLSSFPGKRR
jgi:hypothetical protein